MGVAKPAKLFHFNSPGIILFIFGRSIISLFAFATGQRNQYTHLYAYPPIYVIDGQ